MFSISTNAGIFLYNKPMDMRNSFEGLSVAIEKTFSEKVVSGSFFVFFNRSRDKVKILYWDVDGFAIWYKRLEKGRFLKNSSKTELNRKELVMILEGITPKKIEKRYSVF
jgi:transposase